MVKKKTIKKKTVKKKISKKKAKSKILKKVKPECYFVLIDGKKITNLPQLALEIETMNDDVFFHHVREDNNDFANWIKEVIGEIKLADKIIGINEKNDLQLEMLKHIVKSIK
ncbi:hypothetical protein HN415_10380 [Candidatus Woesearchaeota archaeon]|nr:hypothetical protein [Candidatus Woesearchaeota archaeon]